MRRAHSLSAVGRCLYFSFNECDRNIQKKWIGYGCGCGYRNGTVIYGLCDLHTQQTFYFTNNQFYLFAEVQLHDFIIAKLTARSLSPRNNACFVNTLILDSNQIKFICTINEHQKTITIDADGRKMRTSPSFSLLYSLSLRSLGCSVVRSFSI